MFEFLFNYPRSVFSKGEFVLLGAWPKWVLIAMLVAAAGGLAWLIRSRLPQAAPELQSRRAIMVAELRPQQNIIAVLVDDSRSMAISENGATREGQAVKSLEGGVLNDLAKKFQTRLYRMDKRA